MLMQDKDDVFFYSHNYIDASLDCENFGVDSCYIEIKLK